MEGASEGSKLRAVGRSMAELLQEVAEGMNARIKSESAQAGGPEPGEEKKVRLERREALLDKARRDKAPRQDSTPSPWPSSVLGTDWARTELILVVEAPGGLRTRDSNHRRGRTMERTLCGTRH